MFARALFVLILLAACQFQGQSLSPQNKPGEATVEVVGHKTLSEAAAYQSPVLADQASLISDFTLKVGNLQLDFKSGVGCPVLVGGKVRGLYLQGPGRFRYLAKDPVVQPLLRFNLKENTEIAPVAAGEALTVGEPLKEAIVWFVGRDIPVLAPPTLPAPNAAFQATQTFFEKRDQGLPSSLTQLLDYMPIGQLAAYQAANDLYMKKHGAYLETNNGYAYTGILVIADVLERAKSTDPDKIVQAFKTTDFKDHPMVGDAIKFAPNGDNINATTAMIQILPDPDPLKRTKIVLPKKFSQAPYVFPAPQLWER